MDTRVIEFKEDEMEDMTSIFKLLSDPSRVRILSILSRRKSLSVGNIANHLGMEISLVSHHLSTLKILGFVKPRKEGKQVFYSIGDDCIIDILQRARDHVSGN
jgi:ArsR family transcriptional regulator